MRIPILAALAAALAQPAAAQSVPCEEPYVVRPGDTLQRIARRAYGPDATYRDLWAANRDRLRGDPSLLEIGDVVLIPCRGAQIAEPPTAEPQVAEPQIAEPQIAESQTAEPQTAEPQTAEPQAAEPPKAEDEAPPDRTAEPDARPTDVAPAIGAADAGVPGARPASDAAPSGDADADAAPQPDALSADAQQPPALQPDAPQPDARQAESPVAQSPLAETAQDDAAAVAPPAPAAVAAPPAAVSLDGDPVTLAIVAGALQATYGADRFLLRAAPAGEAAAIRFPMVQPGCEFTGAGCETALAWSAPLIERPVSFVARIPQGPPGPQSGPQSGDGPASICIAAELPQGAARALGLARDPRDGRDALDCLRAVAAGEATMAVAPAAAVDAALSDPGLSDAVAEATSMTRLVALRAAAPADDPEAMALLAALDEGLRLLRESGAWLDLVAAASRAQPR